MNVARYCCSMCAGAGKIMTWEYTHSNSDGAQCTMKQKESMCPECNGKGHLEYAQFTIDEAKAILKHCGLTTACD